MEKGFSGKCGLCFKVNPARKDGSQKIELRVYKERENGGVQG